MNNIFISYRRADSADVVGRIYDYLEGIVGKDNIFKDVHSVQLGIDYLTMTIDAVGNCDVQLAIIGNQWLNGRRIDDPNDLVRVEIETAMSRDIPVIPVLVGGAEMPAEDELPDGLKPLRYRNAIKVRPDPDFPTDMARLVQALQGIISIEPQSRKPAPSGNKKWLPLIAAGVVLAAVGITYFIGSSGPEEASRSAEESGDAGSDATGEMSRSASATSAGPETERVNRAMEFVDQYNGAGQLLDARNRVSEATNNGMDQIAEVLKNPDFSEQELAAAYSDTILSMVEEERLATSLEQLFKFYEQVLICREMQLCDEDVLAGFFDTDAGGFSRTFYPWVCQVRADWNNPDAFDRVMDFYLEGDSQTVCD
ncbi:MAG TPA: TIR domain-containing protein [Xanthomonadales bacterium]|nr:TIR domain-containing protein [Xanthomonadales bacterium]